MKRTFKSDNPVTNAAAKAATGKTLDQWFAELDKADGLKLGRREINSRLYAQKIDLWWCTTIAVEYEKHHDVRKKDGLFEGYFVCSTKTIGAPPADVFCGTTAWTFTPLSRIEVRSSTENVPPGLAPTTTMAENGAPVF